VVKEQFVEVLLKEVRVWVKERKPRITQETGRVAEDYRQARKVNLWTSAPKTSARRVVSVQRGCYSCGQPRHLAKDCSSGGGKKVSLSASSKEEDVVKGQRRMRDLSHVIIVVDMGILQSSAFLLWHKEVCWLP